MIASVEVFWAGVLTFCWIRIDVGAWSAGSLPFTARRRKNTMAQSVSYSSLAGVLKKKKTKQQNYAPREMNKDRIEI